MSIKFKLLIKSVLHFLLRTTRYIIRLIIPLDKYQTELAFWKEIYRNQGNRFDNKWYVNILLPMSGEDSSVSFKNKVIADFGCGPQGSLEWAKEASERIGIDVLIDKYESSFDLSGHNMHYVTCSETEIPLPDNSVDVLFTLNAMDHTTFFEIMSKECLRILKPEGLFVGEFNLNEKFTVCEPQVLTESRVKENILNYLDISYYRLTKRGKHKARFKYFFGNDDLQSGTEKICMLWIRGNKKNSSI
jgi:SAM-dependent methyltransferase